MLPVFKDTELEKQISERGYVVLPALDKSEVERLRTEYEQIHAEHGFGDSKGMQRSAPQSTPEYRERLFDFFQPVFLDFLEKYMPDYEATHAAYLLKYPGPDSNHYMHNDFCYVDEKKYRALGLWFPLVDVNRNNGTLYFLKGSHLFNSSPFAPRIPTIYSRLPRKAEKYFEPVEFESGSVAIFDCRIGHYSPENRSNKPRPAVRMSLAPRQAEMYLHYPNNNDPDRFLDLYRIPRDFMRYYEMDDDPADYDNTFNLGTHEYKIDFFTMRSLKANIREWQRLHEPVKRRGFRRFFPIPGNS